MIIECPAKINLGLNIVGKRNDGFHDLDSVFLKIPFCDILELQPNGKDEYHFTIEGIKIDGSISDNLCMKVVRALKTLGHEVPGFDCILLKNIPTGAGLGGGSSDAASMLKILLGTFDIEISHEEQFNLLLGIGSDCPFFLGGSAAHVRGRGEIIEDIDFSLEGYSLALYHPGIHVSTKEAYSNVTINSDSPSTLEVVRTPLTEWKNTLKNDFEASIFPAHKSIEHLKSELYRLGAIYASMSGSGSSVFGIFEELPSNLPQQHLIWKGKL